MPIMHNTRIDAGFTLERFQRHALYACAIYRVG
jgi:hypothetical protein